MAEIQKRAFELADAGARLELHNLLRAHESELPKTSNVYRYMAEYYIKYDFADDAARCLNLALECQDRCDARLLNALLTPQIPGSFSEIDHRWSRVFTKLDETCRRGGRLIAPARQLGRPLHFRYSYFGYNVRPLHEKIANTLVALQPNIRGDRIDLDAREPGPLRIGVFFNYARQSAMYRAFYTSFMMMQEKMCEIVGITENKQQTYLPGINRWIVVPGHLAYAKRKIASLDLDMLIYTEIGMNIIPYFLAFSRVARVQTVMGGHPVSTGCPQVDDFIASSEIERSSATSHYSENLVRIPGINFPPQKEVDQETREESVLGELVSGGYERVYYIPNAPHKITPTMDLVIERILAQDTEGCVLVFEAHIARWQGHLGKLKERWKTSVGEKMDRIVVHQPLPIDKFIKLCSEVNVVLDTPGFGMGSTAFYAFWTGTPVLGFDGSFNRERMAVAINERFGRRDLIASSPEDLADRAVAVATSPEWQQEIRASNKARREQVYESEIFANGFADYVVRRAEEGRRWYSG